jgi:hypothetical protein
MKTKAKKAPKPEAKPEAKPELSHSEQQAVCQLESIRDMIAALECDYDRLEELRDERDSFEIDEDVNLSTGGPGYANSREAWAGENTEDAEELSALEGAAGECKDRDEAEQRIQEDPLSVQVRGGWHDVGANDEGAEEYEILLCTGGPACRIIGELRNNEPHSARLQHQDWHTPWTEHITTGADHDALMAYARQFFYGE